MFESSQSHQSLLPEAKSETTVLTQRDKLSVIRLNNTKEHKAQRIDYSFVS